MPKTITVATTAMSSVRRALFAVDARITDEHSTPGAVGYTTITVTPKGA